MAGNTELRKTKIERLKREPNRKPDGSGRIRVLQTVAPLLLRGFVVRFEAV
jgi:hypothetical protein